MLWLTWTQERAYTDWISGRICRASIENAVALLFGPARSRNHTDITYIS